MSLKPTWSRDGIDLYLGDCLDVLPQLRDGTFDLCITSPPYNSRKNYGAVSDEIPWPEYYAVAQRWLAEVYRVLRRGGTVAVNVPPVIRWQRDHKHNDTWFGWDATYKSHRGSERTLGKARIEPLGFRLFDMMAAIDSHVREPIVWVKSSNGTDAFANETRAGCDSDPYMRPCHEWVLLGSKGQWFHRGGTGQRGRNAIPDLSHYKDAWLLPAGRCKGHSATFPLELVLRLARIFTHAPDAIILDPFVGSGTTILAAIEMGLPAVGVEKNPGFFWTVCVPRVEKALAERSEQLAFKEAV